MSAQAVNTKQKEAIAAHANASLWDEIISIALAALSLLLFLCLFTYGANDPSWNVAGPAETRNLIGRLGANLATTLFQFFGVLAYLIPAFMGYVAWRIFRTETFSAPAPRVSGFLLMLWSAATWLDLPTLRRVLTPVMEWFFGGTFWPGGMMGAILARPLENILHFLGATILLLTLAIVGFVLATGLSFVEALLISRDFLRTLPDKLQTRLAQFRAWRARQREAYLVRVEARRLKRATALAELAAQKAAAEAQTAASQAVTSGNTDAHAPNVIVANRRRKTGATTDSSEETITAPAILIKRERTNNTPDAETQTSHAPENGRDEVPFSLFGAPDANENNASSTPRVPLVVTLKPASETDAANGGINVITVVRKNPDDDPETDESTSESIENIQENIAPQAQVIVLPVKKKVPAEPLPYDLPVTDFLHEPPPPDEQADAELLEIADQVQSKYAEFKVEGRIEHICPGPVVTTYEFKPAPGIKYSRITGLVDDLCLALKTESIRIDRVPGKAHVGVEVPNPHRATIYLRPVIESRQFQESNSKLTIALGKTIDGMNYVTDLGRMPHLLIAGATGAGKSVGVNSLVVSILYKARPDEVKFIMIDPKRLELGLYEGIPHLAAPIITDPKRATFALRWAVCEMERRYKELAGWGVRNIDGYNAEVRNRNLINDFDTLGDPWKTLPYIVIIVDELADLMMTSGREVEESITRLAQMARAVGIHLVLATQRPSVDVITGLIKANFPSRIAFRVSSKVDSRTIIDGNGAEALLGRGDMLFLPPSTARLVRVHGAFVDEKEIGQIVEHIKQQGAPEYDQTITMSEEESEKAEIDAADNDPLFADALRECVAQKKASTSWLQRRLRIGYGRAAAILDAMERQGLIGPNDGARGRQVLPRAYELVSDWEEEDAGR